MASDGAAGVDEHRLALRVYGQQAVSLADVDRRDFKRGGRPYLRLRHSTAVAISGSSAAVASAPRRPRRTSQQQPSQLSTAATATTRPGPARDSPPRRDG